MAHVWNITDGDIYVSKNGDDLLGDGSASNPYASQNKATTEGNGGDKIVMGSGLWSGTRGTSTNVYTFVADGNAVLDSPSGYVDGDIIDGFEIINGWGNSIYKELLYLNWRLYNCRIDVLYIPRDGQGLLMKNTTVDYLYATASKDFNVNCTFLNIEYISYYTFDSPKNNIYVKFNKAILSVLASQNCCFVSNDGSAGLNNLSFQDPRFNNSGVGDYTLRFDSPCLFTGKNNANIGAKGLAYSFDSNSPEFSENLGAVFSKTVLLNDIIKLQQEINGISHFFFQLRSGISSGDAESTWIDFQQVRFLLKTNIIQNIIYDSNGIGTGIADNQQDSGEKCIYYDFELKYCDTETEKASAVWKEIVWNKKVEVDGAEEGNASYSFNPATADYISARYVKIKLYMKS